MMGSWFFDENFNGLPDEIFDDATFFDFPLEDLEDIQAQEQAAQWEHLDPPPGDFLNGCFTNSGMRTYASEFPKSNSALNDKIKPPRSGVMPASGRSIIQSGETSDGKYRRLFHSSSPISVLERSNKCSGENCGPLDPNIVFPVKRPRSKRRRPLSIKPRLAIPIRSSDEKSNSSSDVIAKPEVLPKSLPSMFIHLKGGQEKQLSAFSDALEMKCVPQQPVATRKCTHCETTKTPQWREGPKGPKTLCNACGVRYRTGRLFPEYRPAASPTYVASLHSNSHKKVLELRNKARKTC